MNNDKRFEQLADLVYTVADTAESLDSDSVSPDTIMAVFSDLEYLKQCLDTAFELAVKLAQETLANKIESE
jgi:hypothetical protein